MNNSSLLLKVSDKIDECLYEINDQYELKNVEWDVNTDSVKKHITVKLEDFGTGGSIIAKINKEDLFCAAMVINRNKKYTVYSALAGLITATLLNNLAIAGIKSLADICSEKDLKFFLNRFNNKEE